MRPGNLFPDTLHLFQKKQLSLWKSAPDYFLRILTYCEKCFAPLSRKLVIFISKADFTLFSFAVSIPLIEGRVWSAYSERVTRPRLR